jgi:hypothetical protein
MLILNPPILESCISHVIPDVLEFRSVADFNYLSLSTIFRIPVLSLFPPPMGGRKSQIKKDGSLMKYGYTPAPEKTPEHASDPEM